MNTLMPNVSSCCNAFRLGREAEASGLFELVLDDLSIIIENNPRLMTAALQRSIAIALGCQQKRDWIGLADELEYVITPQLEKND